MALTLKILGIGVLNSTSYAEMLQSGLASITKSTLIKNIMLVNTSASASATINIQLVPGGSTARHVAPIDLQIPPKGQMILDEELTLLSANGTVADKIQGKVASGNTVDYVINGLQRDL